MSQKERKMDPYESYAWIAYEDQVAAIIKGLELVGFTKYEMGKEEKRVMDEGFLWYIDEDDNRVTFSPSRENGPMIMTCTQGAICVVRDALGGLDTLRVAHPSDL